MNPFEMARLRDPLVNRMFTEGKSKDQIIMALVKEKETMANRIFELELIAPKKFIEEDGTSRIWRCPDHLVPEIK